MGMAGPARGAEATAVDYSSVQNLFTQHCLDCHAAQDPEGNLVLESFETLMKGGESGTAIVAGKSADSLLVRMVEGSLEKEGKKKIMPPGKRKKLSPEEIALVRSWIDTGARAPKETPKVARELVLPKVAPTVPPRRSIQALAYAPGAKLLAVARYGEVELFSPESRTVVKTLSGHRGMVNAVAISQDGKLLAAASGEPALFGEVRLWNLADSSLVRVIEGHNDALYSTAISPDGKIVATGSYDQKIKLWELATGRELLTLTTDGRLGVGTTAPTTQLEVNGGSKLGGASAPAIKMLKFTGNLAATQGQSVVIVTGVPVAKMLAVQVMVDYTGNNNWMPASYTDAQYWVKWYSSNPDAIILECVAGHSAGIVGLPYRVVLTYEE